MKKPEIKTDSRLSQASSGGKMHCPDCKGYVNPTKQSGRKSNLYLRADLPGDFDPMVRMPDGPAEYYCPICNKRLYGQPYSYGSSTTVKTPAEEKGENFGCFIWATIAVMILVGGWGMFNAMENETQSSGHNPFAWLCLIGSSAAIMLVFVGPDWTSLFADDPKAKAKAREAKAREAKAREAKARGAKSKVREAKAKAKAAKAKVRATEAKARRQRLKSVNSFISLAIEAVIRKEVRKPTGELTKAVLEKVTRLPFSRTNITDVDLMELAKLKNLTRLYLNRTQITDKGLKELAKLENLTHLNLKSTNITDAGLAELKKVLPKCQIKHNLTK
jgi:hypothetical protein